jgi:hypothetical protein
MASGFLVLPDGRCFSVRWSAHDAVMRAVTSELERQPEAEALATWLRTRIPSPEDEEEIGYGAFFRRSDGKVVLKHLDLRLLTVENQRLVCAAAKRACVRPSNDQWLQTCLDTLVDMILRFERGEPPLSRSDWTFVQPAKPERLGPGWN